MAYDERLAERLRAAMGPYGPTERKMFGGLAFMIGGNMACGIIGRDLMVRVGPQAHDAALAEPHVRPMDFTGRPMRGYVYVAPEGIGTAPDLARWAARSAKYASGLPPKSGR